MPTATDRKLIVTNHRELVRKYGAGGLDQIKKAVKTLVEADEARGRKTVLVPMDDAKVMAKHNAPPVTVPADSIDPTWYRQNKAAVDALFTSFERPEYLMLLGSIDVIPHQNLINPVHAAADPDQIAFGDLAYACDHGYSSNIKNFLAPTRVVGRLPDLVDGKDPQTLVALLNTAADYKSSPASAYAPHLGISAARWQNSTERSLEHIFGNAGGLNLSPAAGPDWPDPVLRKRAHFINCHGNSPDIRFYGQDSTSFPIAHEAIRLGAVTEGTVVAAECCYGAELFNPVLTDHPGICNTYLSKGAYGFFGSSTISYGPVEGNADADLICQFFLKNVLEGKSLGNATLLARQKFIRTSELTGGVIDPIELKTLAQFSLLGDPSIHPVANPDAGTPTTIVSLRTTEVLNSADAVAGALRSFRRSTLRGMGLVLGKAARTILPKTEFTPSKAIKNRLKKALESGGLADPSEAAFASFEVESPKLAAKALADEPSPTAIHLVVSLLPKVADEPFDRYIAVIGRELEDSMILTTLYSR